MAELKPCPFCGGKAKYTYAMPYNVVGCKKCGAWSKTVVDSYEQQDGKAEAIEAWNKRMPKTPCDLCRFAPPSSGDGKPCSMCVAEGRTEDGKDSN